jgi:SagB-type dehydrogenase family enzyme
LERLPDELGRAMDSELPVEPAAVLLVTAVFARTMWKYEDIGLGLVYKDAGALLQTLYMVAQALDLAGCAVHLRGENEIAAWLGLDPMEESLVACFALGAPAA